MAPFQIDGVDLDRPASEVAPRLLGCLLERTLNGQVLRVRIVETEAYDQSDVASHSYRGQTERTRVMFGEAGHLYVYFTYGMHYCCNVVTGPAGHGAGVLIRAAEPLAGEGLMVLRRHGLSGIELTNGPAKLCQALAIDKKLSGHDLSQAPLKLVGREPLAQDQIVQTPRVGISRGRELPWRFYVADSSYVSKA